jgi:hypothetical protein
MDFMDVMNNIDKIKEFGFTKYCNCYNYPNNKINAECYDTVLEAVKAHEFRPNTYDKYESRLVYLNRLLPEFMQRLIINNAFNKPVNITNK